jgi:hypothetical protein
MVRAQLSIRLGWPCLQTSGPSDRLAGIGKLRVNLSPDWHACYVVPTTF